MFPHEIINLETAQDDNFISVSQNTVNTSQQKLTQAEINHPDQYQNISKAQALAITNYNLAFTHYSML